MLQTRILVLIVLVTIQIVIGDTVWADLDLAREPIPKSWQPDAELTDVYFLNSDLGWAVGDKGLVLQTKDGGKTWNRIADAASDFAKEMPLDQKFRHMQRGVQSGLTGIASVNTALHNSVSCRFESVFFLNKDYGWIAGGYDVPYVDRSRGVIMRTTDGGRSWQTVRGLVVPRIKKINFKTPLIGWAVGDAGNLFANGIFITRDGGQTWASESGDKLRNWVDAAKVGKDFVLVDERGTPAVFKDKRLEVSIMPREVERPTRAIKMITASTGYAVGDGGLVMKTENGGKSWYELNFTELGTLKSQIDFTTICTSGTRIVMSGNPGTHVIVHDVETGVTNVAELPRQVRINRVFFGDDTHGWAVGALGTILATRDGGQSWVLQHGEHSRVAILGIASDPQKLPLEILVKYGDEEGRICATTLLQTSDTPIDRVRQATSRLGTAYQSGIRFDLQQPNAENDLLQQLVREIRQLKPNVIVCHPEPIQSNQGISLHTSDLIKKAIQLASQTNAFPDQIQVLKLRPWQVQRLAQLDQSGNVSLDTDLLLPGSASLVSDRIAISRALVGLPALANKTLRYRVDHFASSFRMRGSDLLSNLSSSSGIPTRKTKSKRGSLTAIQQASLKQKKFDELASFEASTNADFAVWRKQLQSTASPMEPDMAGTWLMQLTERYLASGKTELAATTATMLVNYWPDHAFAPAALTWLAQYYSSREFGQIELKKIEAFYQANGSIGAKPLKQNQYETNPQTFQQGGTDHLVWVPTKVLHESQSNGTIQQVSWNVDTESKQKQFFEDRMRSASHFLSKLGQRDPELAAGSQYRWMEAHITQRLNGITDGEGRLKNLIQKRELDGPGISIGAQRELDLADKQPSIPKLRQRRLCRRVLAKPVLDGKLDESSWQSVLKTDAMTQYRFVDDKPDGAADQVAFMYDKEYLYIGLICQKSLDEFYTSRQRARPRDADLSRRDRVEIQLDQDRDYRSTHRFVVDHRGWVHDSCGGSNGWNPTWYVSQSENETSWTVELAIPLDQITPEPIGDDSVWAISLARRGFNDLDMWNSQQHTTRRETGLLSTLTAWPSKFRLLHFQDSSESNESD